MSLLAPVPGYCFGSVQRDGVAEPCPRIVMWHGTLRTTRNGMSWEVDACERHAPLLAERQRIGQPHRAAVGDPVRH